MKKILCYGDSNTYGYIPVERGWYAPDIRWTGRLAKLLGQEYFVIEEGLNSRTTVLDDPLADGKNGLTALIPCLEDHFPVEAVILILGSNDMKVRFQVTAADAVKGVAILIDTIRAYAEQKNTASPVIILVSQPHIARQAIDGSFDERSVVESGKFSKYYAQTAKEKNCIFFDAAAHISPSEGDGLHLMPDAHAILAEEFYKIIQNI